MMTFPLVYGVNTRICLNFIEKHYSYETLGIYIIVDGSVGYECPGYVSDSSIHGE